jgi:uncharacterized protein HemX
MRHGSRRKAPDTPGISRGLPATILSDLLPNYCALRRNCGGKDLFRVSVAFRVGCPETIPSFGLLHLMNHLTRDHGAARAGTQPIALAAVTLLVIFAGAASIALWRAYSGAAPESDKLVAARQLQARTAQASEQLVEKTKGLEATQQESIDQLQMVQEQLHTVRQLLTAQQADTRRLSDQVSALSQAVDGLRQSHASTQASEQPSASPPRNRSIRARAHASRTGQRHRRGG